MPIRSLLTVSVITALAATVVGHWLPDQNNPNSAAPINIQAPEIKRDTPGRSSITRENQLALELAVKYLEVYGQAIEQPEIQARLYNERRKLRLQAARPVINSDALFETAIRTAFPEYADAIFALLKKLDQYNAWLDDHELRLHGLPAMQRQAEIWQQRQARFGPVASQIWNEEKNPVEAKTEKFQRTLNRLEDATDLPLSELAHQLKTTADQLYGPGLSNQLAGSGATGHALFSMDSVQQKLAALPADKRQQAINHLRRQIGYSEDAIQALEKEDQRRDEKWRRGQNYMHERQALTSKLTGEALDAALSELREAHFGVNSPTIEREEEQGFYRFQRGRRYGLN
ncbi:hypothetical protein [Marinobacter sp. VGCF2001]|uniref:hypothetical protein n=1 Tax=Marinobacter sp. VGCF2001 TaxID=3417189 RepID=UPI003CEE8F44